MGLLRRRPREAEVPGWASFLTADQHGVFLAALGRALDARGVNGTVGEGFLLVDGERELDLGALAHTCLRREEADWPAVVEAGFVSGLDAPLGAEEALSAVKIVLSPRADAQAKEGVVNRPVADDLTAVLVLHLPHSLLDVRAQDADAWGVSPDALWERAAANTQGAAGRTDSRVALPGDVEVTFAVRQDPFAASGALWPQTVVADIGPAGALVAVPNRSTLAVHAITHLGVLEGMRHLLPLIARRHAEGPDPVSDQLYWFREGTLIRVGATVDGEWVSVTPPAQFVAAINELPAPRGKTGA